MINDSIEAWLLHKQPLGDTSIKLIMYSKEQGIIPCIYKGGRLPTKQTLLQPFIPLWLSVSQKKNSQWYYIRKIEHSASPLDLKGMTLFAGLYINELIYYLLSNTDLEPQFYTSYEKTLTSLAQSSERITLEVILRYFEYELLQVSGYAFSFTDEAYSHQTIQAERTYHFIAGQGFIASKVGFLGQDILAIGQGRLTEPHQLKLAKYIMRQAINHALDGRQLFSRHLFRANSSAKQ